MFDRLTAIEVFQSVVRNQSQSAAATELNMSRTSVSRYIQHLENWLGSRLILRTTRSSTVTEAGYLFYDECKEILHKLDTLENKLVSLDHAPSGQLRVSLPEELRSIVMPSLGLFFQRYPNLKLTLDFNERYIDLIAEPFDLALRIGQLTHSSLFARKLGSFAEIPVATPSLLHTLPEITQPEDLTEHNCILEAFRGADPVWHFKQNQTSMPINVTGMLTVNSTDSVLAAVKGGLGIALVPDLLCQDELDSGQLIRLLPNYQTRQVDMHALFPERDFMPTKTRVFVDHLIQLFNSPPP